MPDPQSHETADPPRNPGHSRSPGFSVLDASALLTLLFQETGATAVADAIADGAAVSTVNLSEVVAILVRHERDADRVMHAVIQQVTVESFTTEDALAAAALWAPTRATGLSLGDRACLALAQRLGVPAVTADREWANVTVGITIQLLRPARS
jgi:PIN domain nuclease of toxin-antitoxin system